MNVSCLSPEEINSASYDLISYLVDLNDSPKIKQLSLLGFYLEEIRISFFKEIKQSEKIPSIGVGQLATIDDLDQMASFAHNFVESRFKVFGAQSVYRFYETWIYNAVEKKYDDCCLVIRDDKVIKGFISIRHITPTVAQVGLISTNSKFRGTGVGKELLILAENYCQINGFSQLRIDTQVTNIPAMNFYSSCGYRLQSTNAWFYLTPNREIK